MGELSAEKYILRSEGFELFVLKSWASDRLSGFPEACLWPTDCWFIFFVMSGWYGTQLGDSCAGRGKMSWF